MSPAPFHRPEFDFDLSLSAARDLVAFSEELTSTMQEIGRVRDAALGAWSGPWGDEFRKRAAEETQNIRTTAARCLGDADYWGMVWQQAAIQLNNVIYAEAVMAVKDEIAGKKAQQEREREEALKEQHGAVGGVIVEGAIDTGEAIWGFFVGKDPLGEALDRVTGPPEKPARPTLHSFVPGRNSFAHYSVNGEWASLSYQGTPFVAPLRQVNGKEFDDAEANSGHTAEEAVEEAEAKEPDPVAIDSSRVSLGSDQGVCTINLDLVDEYLAKFAMVDGIGPSVTSLNQSYVALDKTVALAINGCPHYPVPDRGLQVIPLFFSFLAANVNAMTAVRVEVGQDRSGTIEVSNSAITMALEKYGLENAPGLIKITEPEFKGYPPNSGFTDDPICAANGNFVHTEEDLALPGFAAVIAVRRTYNASTSSSGLFGVGWTSVLDMRLSPDPGGGSVLVTLEDGAGITFLKNQEGDYQPHHARQLTLDETATGWRLRQGIDTDWFFDVHGALSGGRLETSTWSVEHDDDSIVVMEHSSGRSVRYELSQTGLVDRAITSDGRAAHYHYQEGADQGRHCVRVDRPSGGTTYEIGDDGRIAALFDVDGVLIARNTYDRWGRAVAQLSPFGRTSRYEYGEHGTTRIFDDQGGPTNAMTHDAGGNLTSMIGGDGRAQRMRWDALDRLSVVRDRKGHTTGYHYHPDAERDQLVKTVHPDGSEEERIWDDSDRLIEVIEPGGGRHLFGYDGDDRYPSTIQDPAGGVVGFTRDERGLPTEIVDGDDVTTLYEWDDDGQVTSIINGVGQRATFSYNDAGELTEVTGVKGETSSFGVDPGGRVTDTIDPAGGQQAIEYSAAGRPVACRDRAGILQWSIEYGSHGYPSRMTDIEGATVDYVYDMFGNRTEIVAPDGDRYGFDYDTLGQLVNVRFGETASAGQEFDPNGNAISITDPDGLTLSREVDELDRTTRITEPSGAETSYTYHSSGPIATVTRPDGSVFSYTIDPVGRVTAVTGPDGATSRFEFSPGGRLTTGISAEGRRTSYGYNAAGQLAAITAPDGSVKRLEDSADGALVAEDDEFVSFQFDEAGRVTSWTNSASGASGKLGWDNSTVSIQAGESTPAFAELDRRGQVSRVTDPAGIVSEFERDLRGRVGSITTGQQTTDFAYNIMGKITEISEGSEPTVEMEYSPAGRLLALHRGQNTEVVCERDEAGRVSAIGSSTDGTRLVSYTHDVSGYVTGATTASGSVRVFHDGYGVLRSVADINGLETTYDRDRDGLLTAMTGDDGRSVDILRSDAGAVIGYRSGDLTVGEPAEPGFGERDQAGRITGDHLGRLHRYDLAGRLVETIDRGGQTFGFEYSTDGLLAADSSPLLGRRTFAYNRRSQLTAIASDEGTATYEYDERGRRVSEREADGAETTYRWNALDQLTEVERQDASGIRTVRQLHYSGLGRVERIDDAIVGWDDVLSLKPVRIGERRFFRSGMHTMEIGSNGGWRDGVTADPFGYASDHSGIDFGFRGELTVDGLVLMGARVYDPRSRLFLSKDPQPAVLANPGAHNPYEYGYGDPINMVDPTGQRPISIEEFGDWKQQQTQSRTGAFVQAIVDDPWGSLALAVVVVAASAMIITGVGAGVGAAILIGVVFSAGEGFANKNFSPTKTTIDGVISGVAAGVGGPIAGKVGGKVLAKVGSQATSKLALWAPKAAQAATQGAVGGFIEGTGSALTGQTFDEYGNFTVDELDPGAALKQGLTSSVTGAVGGVVGSGFQEALDHTKYANSQFANAAVGGATDFTVSAGSSVVTTGELDLVGAAKEGALGFAGDYFEDTLTSAAPTRTTGDGGGPDGDGLRQTGDGSPDSTSVVSTVDAPRREAGTDGDGALGSNIAPDGATPDGQNRPSGPDATPSGDATPNTEATQTVSDGPNSPEVNNRSADSDGTLGEDPARDSRGSEPEVASTPGRSDDAPGETTGFSDDRQRDVVGDTSGFAETGDLTPSGGSPDRANDGVSDTDSVSKRSTGDDTRLDPASADDARDTAPRADADPNDSPKPTPDSLATADDGVEGRPIGFEADGLATDGPVDSTSEAIANRTENGPGSESEASSTTGDSGNPTRDETSEGTKVREDSGNDGDDLSDAERAEVTGGETDLSSEDANIDGLTLGEGDGAGEARYADQEDLVRSPEAAGDGSANNEDGYVYRGDDTPKSPEGNKPDQLKSHVDPETGNLVPANPDGSAEVHHHVRGQHPSKSDSPYTSLTPDGGIADGYGEYTVRVDRAQLEADIASGKVQGVEVLSPEQVQQSLRDRIGVLEANYNQNQTKKNQRRLERAEDDLAHASRDNEYLIKGTVPADYLEILN